MINTVVRCSNNMVMVFDNTGEQIPEHQGYYPEVKEIILKEAPPSVIFSYLLDFRPEFLKVSREEW